MKIMMMIGCSLVVVFGCKIQTQPQSEDKWGSKLIRGAAKSADELSSVISKLLADGDYDAVAKRILKGGNDADEILTFLGKRVQDSDQSLRKPLWAYNNGWNQGKDVSRYYKPMMDKADKLSTHLGENLLVMQKVNDISNSSLTFAKKAELSAKLQMARMEDISTIPEVFAKHAGDNSPKTARILSLYRSIPERHLELMFYQNDSGLVASRIDNLITASEASFGSVDDLIKNRKNALDILDIMDSMRTDIDKIGGYRNFYECCLLDYQNFRNKFHAFQLIKANNLNSSPPIIDPRLIEKLDPFINKVLRL